MIVTTSFAKIIKLTHKNKVIQGSQGAAKTFSILLRWVLMADKFGTTPQHCTIVSDTMPNLRIGAIKDFATITRMMGVKVTGTKTPHVYQIKSWTFEFFSCDDESKGLGGRRDRLFINEANRLPWKTARQLISRTHLEVIMDFNPREHFWAHDNFVDIGDCDFIKLTYKDNEQLPISEVESIEKHAPWGLVPDENYWRVYGLGEIGFVEGSIFKDFQEFDTLPEGDYQESYGVDFGGEDPMSVIQVWVDHKNKRIYWKELFYASHAPIDDVGRTILDSDYKGSLIACDHNPTQFIFRLREMGLNALTANKKNGIVADLRVIKQYNLFIHQDSLNLKSEARDYAWQIKKDIIVEYPDQTCSDHALDAARYGTIISIRS